MTKLAVVALVVAGCADKQAAPEVAITGADVAAVNAAIPSELKGKIEFEIGTVEIGLGKRSKKKLRLVMPKGWKPGFMAGELEPADAGNFGSPTLGKTSLELGSNCDGVCEAKDWAAVSDKVVFAHLAAGKAGNGKVIKDVKGKNTRTMVFEHAVAETFADKDVAITVVTAWWIPDGEKYFTCRAELGTPVKGLAAAFELACSKVSGD